MKLFDKYFQPYAEYCLRTTFSEDELKEALAKECPATSDILSWKAIKAAIGLSKTIVFSCDPDDRCICIRSKHTVTLPEEICSSGVKKQQEKKRFCIFQSLKAENTNGCCMLSASLPCSGELPPRLSFGGEYSFLWFLSDSYSSF